MKRIFEIILLNHYQLRKLSIAIDGKRLSKGLVENPLCAKCTSRECLELPKEYGEFVCKQGLSYYCIQFDKFLIVTYGLLGKSATLKRGHYAYKHISKLEFELFQSIVLEQLKIIEDEIEKIKLELKNNILNSFHDASKWARQISISSERLLWKSSGNLMLEKFQNSSPEIKAIYKCSALLDQALQTYEIYINPMNVDFGLKKDTSIYQLFDKFQAILYHSEAKSINRSFKLEGSSYSKIPVYESFATIPLSLLHNAMKYSIGQDKIIISFDEFDKYITVKVTSTGPYITEDEKNKIFEKNFRGKYASKLHSDGLGIGLYVAKIVAQQHNSSLEVLSSYLNYERNAIPIAENTFILKILKF